MKRLLLPVLLTVATPFLLSMSKKQDVLITFHTLATGTDSRKSVFPADVNGKRLYFRISPEFSQANIAAYQDFASQDGKSKGVVLQLDSRGRDTLEIITRTHRDEYLLALVNAKPVDFVVMDEPVTDGQITIWQNVPDEVIKGLAKKHPRMKKGAPPTMSQDFDMLPTTKKEKEKFLEAQRLQDQQDAKRTKAGKPTGPEVPSVNVPNGPTSPQLPIEGGGPTPQNPPLPQAEPPLPPLPR